MNQEDKLEVWASFAEVACGRHSIRAFLPTPVGRDVISEILRVAARAPSGTNTQPWHVHVVAGAARDRLVAAACALYDQDPTHSEGAYDDVYVRQYGEPYASRRRALGKALYGLMGIGKGETEKMLAQRRRNFEFFGAPVGLFFTIDRLFRHGSWMDVGMFIQNVMLAARAKGLDTCAQAFWVDYQSLVSAQLGFPEHQRLVCGMSLGVADPAAPENRLISERADLSEFCVFHSVA